MHETSLDISVRLAAAVDNMPAFTKSVEKILALTRDIAGVPQDLPPVIEKTRWSRSRFRAW